MCEAEGAELKVKGQKMGSTPRGPRQLVSTEEEMCCGQGPPFSSDRVWVIGQGAVREVSTGQEEGQALKTGSYVCFSVPLS